MKLVLFLCLIAFHAAFPAEFVEGTIQMKMNTSQGDGTIGLKISPAAVRSNVNMGLGQLRMDMVFLIKMAQPAQVIQIHDDSRTYSYVNLSDADGAGGELGKLTVKKLGEKKILGYKTNHISVTGKGFKSELWVAKEIGLYETLKKLQKVNQNNPQQAAIFRALEKKGLEGFPLKMWWMEGEGSKVNFEVTRITPEKLKASLFEIPKGYKQTEGNSLVSPQNVEGLKKIFENMTPEQQEAIRKMMQDAAGSK